MAGRRVLFLRTFLDDDTNFVILNSLALSLDHGDRLEIVGDSRDQALVEKHWQMAFGPGSRPESRIDFIASTPDRWQREILDRICRADAVVLFASPKDVDFPEFPFPNTTSQIGGAGDWERFVDSPMVQPLTGRGLLREVCYLNRLQRLPDTVVVCDSRHQPAFDDLIALAGMMGDAMDVAGNLVTPRLTAADKQIGHLRKAFRGITYRRPDNREIMPNLARAIRQALREILADEHPRPAGAWTLQDLCGTSPLPRRLPPDNELKIMAFTEVENVYFLPSGQIVEVDHQEMQGILTREAIRTGCPYCRAPIDQIFFYISGLERRGFDGAHGQRDLPMGKCQRCGHKSSYWGEALEPQ